MVGLQFADHVGATEAHPQQQHDLLIDFIDLAAQRRPLGFRGIGVGHFSTLNNIKLGDAQRQGLGADVAELDLCLRVLSCAAQANNRAVAKPRVTHALTHTILLVAHRDTACHAARQRPCC
ncbi:hypothetical protein G6F24_017548 [Rhizopus arrhizus]|nr:hypothetical protein G6F24_017548 [Rhizopus arrhizus]